MRRVSRDVNGGFAAPTRLAAAVKIRRTHSASWAATKLSGAGPEQLASYSNVAYVLLGHRGRELSADFPVCEAFRELPWQLQGAGAMPAPYFCRGRPRCRQFGTPPRPARPQFPTRDLCPVPRRPVRVTDDFYSAA